MINWEEAIKTRRSARNYEMINIEDEKIKILNDFIVNMKTPFNHNIECRFFKAEPTKKLYFTMQSPPDNIAFISETDVISISKVGFIGELIILYAQSLGIATCWYGHYKLSELEKLMPHLENASSLNEANMGFGYSKGEVEGRRAICVTPLGYHNERGLRLIDRMTEKMISYKRRQIEELVTSKDSLENITDTVRYALDLARLAPSAANSQHWRFNVSDDSRKIEIAMPVGYKHLKWEHPNVDIGICASHFYLGLKLKGIDPKVTVTEDSGRAIWTFELD